MDEISGAVLRGGDYDGTTDTLEEPTEYMDVCFEGGRTNRYRLNPSKTERIEPGEPMRHVYEFVGYVPEDDNG